VNSGSRTPSNLLESENGKAGIYIHYPFCLGKCPYCHFYSVPLEGDLHESWLEGIEREVGTCARMPEWESGFDTIYIGGGTPSLLDGAAVLRIREWLDRVFSIKDPEFTLEVNPSRLKSSVLRDWRRAGVNRLSIGVQSFDDEVLRLLNRRYAAAVIRPFFEDCRDAGFQNIGVDFMLGIPRETRDNAARILDGLAALHPEHVSLYLLEELEGLPFEKVVALDPPNEDFVVDSYHRIKAGLAALGIEQYEISNFSRPGRKCRHNLKYWRYLPFLGLGPSACSLSGKRRWSNPSDLGQWFRSLRSGELARDEDLSLSGDEQLSEALISGLRLVEGVRPSIFLRRFGLDIWKSYEKELSGLEQKGLLILEPDRIRIPSKRMLISNRVMMEFV